MLEYKNEERDMKKTPSNLTYMELVTTNITLGLILTRYHLWYMSNQRILSSIQRKHFRLHNKSEKKLQLTKKAGKQFIISERCRISFKFCNCCDEQT